MTNEYFGEKRGAILRHIFFLALLVLVILWWFAEDKITFRLTSTSLAGEQPTEKQMEVHPAVLNLQESFARVAETVKPAVVNITTIHIEKFQESPFEFFFWDPDEMFEQFFNMPSQPRSKKTPQPQKRSFQRKVPGTGSGVIIDPDGFILTNEHVVRGADEIKVTLADEPDKKLDGQVIGRDERTDLAVVKIKPRKKLPYAKLGDSDRLRVGDWAIAIGSPFGLEQTVTVGVISASRQNVSIQNRNYKDLIQTDAAINPGNSGGPLLNIYGEVIGINTAIYTPSGGFAGVGFAIPISRAKEILPQLREKGKVIRGWIGVVLEDKIDDATASVFGVPDKQGSMIKKVLPDYPAAKAGLKRGDVIVEFAGNKIKDNADLQSIVAATPPDKKVAVKIIRNKKEMSLDLTLAEAPALDTLKKGSESESPATEGKGGPKVTWLGADVEELTSTLRERYSVSESEKGVIVTNVEQNSKSEEIGLMTGDVVRQINQEEVSNLKTFNEIIKKVKLSQGVVFDILRRGESLYLSYMGPEK